MNLYDTNYLNKNTKLLSMAGESSFSIKYLIGIILFLVLAIFLVSVIIRAGGIGAP